MGQGRNASDWHAVARAAKGFLPDDEGMALHRVALDCGMTGAPLVEIGSYCGKSTVYLGAGARQAGTVLFTVDHHRGSEEMQSGWEHHDPEVVDAQGRMDSLPFLRQTLADAGLEQSVIPVVGASGTVARYWRTPVALVFIDGGHALELAMADYDGWAPWIMPGGTLAIHDVFEDPAEGGQAPFEVWQRACRDGFTPSGMTGSLRLLQRPTS